MTQLGQIDSASPDETVEIGRRLGTMLAAGDAVALVGVLGAGKTQLVKGIAAGLGLADPRTVTSPTFVLVNEYQGRLRIFHLDAYRLAGAEEMEALGFAEMCGDGGVVIVEWADRVVAAMGRETLWIDLVITGDDQRRMTLRTDSPGLARRLAKWRGDR